MKVRVRESLRDSPYLTPGKEYLVVGLDHESFRVVHDLGEPTLFPCSAFDIVEDAVPEDWVWKRFAEDEFYADPPELSEPGFYEDYFDGKEYAIEVFVSYLRRIGALKRDL